MDATAAATLFSRVDAPLWLITSAAGPQRGGLIASFVAQASLVPQAPRVMLAIARQHFTWELIQRSGCFALHLLSEQNVELVWRFGLASGRTSDKYAGLAPQLSPGGSPLLPGTWGWFDCRVESETDLGDRLLLVGEVLGAHAEPGTTIPAATIPGTTPGPLTLNRLWELASPEQRELLHTRWQHDVQVDAAAIERWRSER